MIIRDRFTRGWVTGASGGLLGGIFSYLPYYLGISKLRLIDWAAILIYGRVPPFSIADQLYALYVLALSTGFVGILFAFLLPLLKEENIYFKGWITFLIPWWMVYLLTALSKTEGTLKLTVATTLSDGIATTITGLTAVYCYRLLEPKSETNNARSYWLPQPVAKPIAQKTTGAERSGDGEEQE